VKKTCTKCKDELDLECFNKHNTGKYGRNSICKACESKRVVAWQQANPDKVRARSKRFAAQPRVKEYRRDWALKNKYGIDAGTYDAMLAEQSGVCAVCKMESDKPLSVDHDHVTGKVRGLLCNNCNMAIGLLADDEQRLRSAADYVAKHRCA
jgi:hypothetical protein